ncbi:MAG: glycosyltransferase family 4 protein [Proteobacteria bacterium]|nr:glycosyltransferase family 4 protein [Pseudomonadota bacterium]
MRIISPMATGSGAYVVHRLLERRIPGYRVSSYHSYCNLFPIVLPQLVSTCNTDLIHTTPDYARFFFRKSVPLVLTFHGYVLDGRMRPYCSLLTNIYHLTALGMWIRLAIKKAHTITAVSRFIANLVQQDMNISQPVKVIYNGVDINHFIPVSSSRPARKEVRVLFSGNLTRRKGAHWLPSIAKKLQKNVRIFYTQGLRTKRSLASGPNLQAIGAVPFKNMPNHYRQMDLLLMPSVREGFGLAVAEAMACGLPVVASNCSAIPELIDDGKGGFLCKVGDVDAFADKINLLSDSPKLRHEMGEYNRAKVEKMFTLDRMAREYQELFDEVLV